MERDGLQGRSAVHSLHNHTCVLCGRHVLLLGTRPRCRDVLSAEQRDSQDKTGPQDAPSVPDAPRDPTASEHCRWEHTDPSWHVLCDCFGINTMCPDVLCSPGCPCTASTAGRVGQCPFGAAAQKILITGRLGQTAPIGPVLALVFLLFQSPEGCPDGPWGPGTSEINLYKYFTNMGYSSGLWVAKRRHVSPTPSVSPDPHAASREETRRFAASETSDSGLC